jgi:nicotinamidase-related amidase
MQQTTQGWVELQEMERLLSPFRRDAPTSELVQAKSRAIEEYLKPGSRKEAALLVIDMQRGFLDAGAALEVPEGRTRCLPNIKRLIKKTRAFQMQVVFSRYMHRRGSSKLSSFPFAPEVFEHEPGTPQGPFHPSSCCLQGDPSSELAVGLAPMGNELVINKYGYDAFHETVLDSELRSRGIRCLYMCGVMTDICVDSTLRSGFHREYRITAISDAVATISARIQDACLDIWKRKFALVKTTSEVLLELETLR